MNPVKVAIEQRQAQDGAKRKLVKAVASERPVSVLSYTDVKGFILGQDWKSSSTSQLALAYQVQAPDAALQKIKQYIQRITWELKKKELQDPNTTKKDQ
ncbi:MAG: hypothetical protein ABI623_04770 [bacterium]